METERVSFFYCQTISIKIGGHTLNKCGVFFFCLFIDSLLCANVINEYLMAQNTLRGGVIVNDSEYKS